MRNGIGKKLSRMIFGTNSYQADDIYQIEDEKTLNSIAWENSDSAVRSAAIDRINSQDPLENIAQNHHDNMARLQAVKRIESQEVLEIIAASDKDANVRLCAIQKLTNEAKRQKILGNEKSLHVLQGAMQIIKNKKAMATVARNTASIYSIQHLDDGIVDEEMLACFIQNIPEKLYNQKIVHYPFDIKGSEFVRDKLLNQIKDQDLLFEIAMDAELDEIKRDAIRMLKEDELIKKVVLNGTDELVRILALELLGRNIHNNTDFLLNILNNSQISQLKTKALEVLLMNRMLDNGQIRGIALNENMDSCRYQAILAMDYDEDTFLALIDNCSDHGVRTAALKRITEAEPVKKELLVDIIKNNILIDEGKKDIYNRSISQMALDWLHPEYLKEVLDIDLCIAVIQYWQDGQALRTVQPFTALINILKNKDITLDEARLIKISQIADTEECFEYETSNSNEWVGVNTYKIDLSEIRNLALARLIHLLMFHWVSGTVIRGLQIQILLEHGVSFSKLDLHLPE